MSPSVTALVFLWVVQTVLGCKSKSCEFESVELILFDDAPNSVIPILCQPLFLKVLNTAGLRITHSSKLKPQYHIDFADVEK